jgi:hypothetical protein
MKCDHCGYDDQGTGDSAHACPRFNRPVTVLSPVTLGIDKDKRIAELEAEITELRITLSELTQSTIELMCATPVPESATMLRLDAAPTALP